MFDILQKKIIFLKLLGLIAPEVCKAGNALFMYFELFHPPSSPPPPPVQLVSFFATKKDAMNQVGLHNPAEGRTGHHGVVTDGTLLSRPSG